MSNPRDVELFEKYNGIIDLTYRFESAAKQRTHGDEKLRDDLLKQNGVIAFNLQMGFGTLDPALKTGPLDLFRAEIKAMALMGLLPEAEVCGLIDPQFKNDEASAKFAKLGAPTLAKIFKP